MDKSWGRTASGGFQVRQNESPEDRAAKRALERQSRISDQEGDMARRSEARIAARANEKLVQERSRVERREREKQSASKDIHAEAAKRHRSSGRKDVVKEQRDTRGFATVIDERRIRELSARGASISGLAAAFAITANEIARILAAPEPSHDIP